MPSTAEMVRNARQAAALSQAALAERAGTSQPTVAAYESGAKTPTLSTLERLLKVCGHELVLDSRPAPPSPLMALIRQRRRRLLAAARRHGARNLRVFGSVARGEENARSDIDLLVDLEPGRTLVHLAALREELADILGTPVDVATLDLLKENIRDQALSEAVPL
jgi:hypothetical protein